MKTRLLRKARKKVKLHERNGVYYINYHECNSKRKALMHYRYWVLKNAKDIFGFRPKSQLFKY
jgi:hypothetical protein